DQGCGPASKPADQGCGPASKPADQGCGPASKPADQAGSSRAKTTASKNKYQLSVEDAKQLDIVDYISRHVPDLKRVGREWEACCPFHQENTPSFKVDQEKGAWNCFGCGRKGDIIQFAQEIHQTDFLGAVGILAREYGGEPFAPKNERSNRKTSNKISAITPGLPPPEQAPPPPTANPSMGPYSRRWEYRDNGGILVEYRCRFDLPGRKMVIPLSWCRNEETGEESWGWKQAPAPRPLYRLHGIISRPNATVLVVEGEKAADAAEKLFPDYAVTTSSGGGNAADSSDWSPMAGRCVVIWPDNDQPGSRLAGWPGGNHHHRGSDLLPVHDRHVEQTHLAALTTTALSGMTAQQAGALTTTWLAGLTATTLASLSQVQLDAITYNKSINETKAVDIAAATTLNLGTLAGNYVHVTGTTAISALGTAQAGIQRTLTFDAATTLTHNATSLILPTAANITTSAGDAAVFVAEGSGNWRCTSFQKASGAPLSGGGASALNGLTDARVNGTSLFLGTSDGAGTTTGSTMVGVSVPVNASGANNTLLGSGAGAGLTTGAGNVFIGKGVAPANTTTSNAVAIGLDAGATTLADNTIAIGKEACKRVTGAYSVGVGVQALGGQNGTLSGGYNVGIGFQTLLGLQTGEGNVAVGHAAGYPVTGHSNVAIGYLAAQQGSCAGGGNVCIGGYSGLRVTGGYNVLVGQESATQVTSANNVICIGRASLYSQASGSDCIVIGRLLDVSSGSATNELNLGGTIFATGLYGTTGRKVGIGLNAPAAQLDVDTGGNVLALRADRASSTATDHIADWVSNVGGTNTTVAYIECDGSYIEVSDARLKTNIVDATTLLEDFMRLQVRHFNWKHDPDGKKVLGFIAQEVAEIFPGMVRDTTPPTRMVKDPDWDPAELLEQDPDVFVQRVRAIHDENGTARVVTETVEERDARIESHRPHIR
ncbi:MAG: hypothetical protein G8237_15580, partial [Magnetococcales bacterium]|nr:hypothetical protein [Magnetococcales bacterium]